MNITGVDVFTIPDRGDSMMLVVVDTDAGIYGLGEVGIRTRQQASGAHWLTCASFDVPVAVDGPGSGG